MPESLLARRSDVCPIERSFERPPDLNRKPDEFGAIKSGVSILWTNEPDLENAVTLSAVLCLASMSELRRIRAAAAEALDVFDDEQQGHDGVLHGRKELAAQRSALVHLSHTLEGLELSLSFGVEAYREMRLLIPERVVECFHDSLSNQLGIAQALRSTDRMLTRLAAIVGAARESITAAERHRDEMRHGKWAAIGTIALPLIVIFGHLGSNTSELQREHSVLDLAYFGLAYAVLIGVLVAIWVWASKERAAWGEPIDGTATMATATGRLGADERGQGANRSRTSIARRRWPSSALGAGRRR